MKILFLHCHKTGGTSLDDALSRNFDPTRSIRLNHSDKYSSNSLDDNHALLSNIPLQKYDYISGHICWDTYKLLRSLTKEDWRVVFALRNPVDQLFSFFRHHDRAKYPTNYVNHRSLTNLDTKEKFLRWITLNDVRHFFNNQTTFASGHSSRKIDEAITNLLSPNCLTASIDYPMTFSRLEERTGLKIKIQHLNKAPSRSVLNEHDQDKVRIIQNLDLQLFSTVSAHSRWAQITD